MRRAALWLGLAAACVAGIAAAEVTDAQRLDGIGPNRPSIKRGSLTELLRIDSRGGRIVPIPEFDLARPGARWTTNGLEMEFERIPGSSVGAYRMRITDPDDYLVASSARSVTTARNRNYLVSALIDTSFSHAPRGFRCCTEINLGVFQDGPPSTQPGGDAEADLGKWNGLPANSNGWVRWEWEFPASALATASYPWLRVFSPGPAEFRIADLKLIELPREPLKPFAKGEGVTFRGGVGALPMAIESCKLEDGRAVVATTGGRYVVDADSDTIEVEQGLGDRRAVATLRSSLDLAGLRVLKSGPDLCVLANSRLTFGIQPDSLLLISPQRPMSVTLTSRIGGVWNRLIAGHLIALDDTGGFTVNPAIPLGSGRLARTSVLTAGLDFVGKLHDGTFTSRAKPGWQVSWQLDPGERLGLSVFPPRPFDWERSFDGSSVLTFWGLPTDVYQAQFGSDFKDFILWDWTRRGYGMSYGPRAIPTDEADLRKHIAAITKIGGRALNYFSMYFYYSRDPREFAAEAARWKATYGIDGIYTDGNPDHEWLTAYEMMRLTREVFPRGTIYLHTTGQSFNGGPPLALPDIFMPFIDTYATITDRGEFLQGPNGKKGWPYPRYVASPFRKANALGTFKGDRWAGVSQRDQYDIFLLYNGRARYAAGPYDEAALSEFRQVYVRKLQALEQVWRRNGGRPDFYETYYLPKARELTGLPFGMEP